MDANASLETANETLNATANVTGRASATREGVLTAYISLIMMAVFPILVGALRSVDYHRAAREKAKQSGEAADRLTTKDAAMFPLIASGALLGLYIFFMLFSKEYINLLLGLYFLGLGVMAISSLIRPFVKPFVPANVRPETTYRLQLTENYHLEKRKPEPSQSKGEQEKTRKEEKSGDGPIEMLRFDCDRVDLVCLLLSFVFGVWYIVKKHWVANNVFGLSFAIKGIEMLSLNSVTNGCILLGGLFLYDVFWVFGTDVMVTVAKTFDAPIKFIFPMDFLEKGLWGSNFALLGLGDVVLPGIFIALLLRFEQSKSTGSRLYFTSTCVAYLAGLILTVVVMHVFDAAQPALLYLVPACLGVPLLLASLKGDIPELFRYEDHPSDEKEQSGNKTKSD